LPDENLTGTLELTIMGEKMSGIACSITSDGTATLTATHNATLCNACIMGEKLWGIAC